MSVTLITPQKIADEALFQLRNNLVMGSLVHRSYEKEFHKIGDTVSVRKPNKFYAADGATLVDQSIAEDKINIVIDKQKHVSWRFTMKDLTLTIEEYTERYIKPAAIALAVKVDADLCARGADFYLAAGTAGTTPNSYAAFGAAAQKMSEMAIPTDGRRCVMNPAAHWAMADALKGVYEPNRVKQILTAGTLGNVAGFDTYEDQNITRNAAGTQNGSYAVNGATEGADGLVTVKTGTGTIKAGNIVTFAGCNAVNPLSKDDLGYLMQFVVTEDYAGGAGDLKIYPKIIPASVSAAYQNVTAYPTDSGAVTVLASHAMNMCFHENAIALCMVPLELPDGAAFKAQATHENLSVTIVKDFDITNYTDIIRIDILYGTKTIYPDLGLRLLG